MSRTWISLALLAAACAPTSPGVVALRAAGEEPRTEPTRSPPVRGGTLLVTRDQRVVVSDADHDVVWILSLADGIRVMGRVALEPGDEPWRLAEDGAGRVHATLRGAGEVVTIDVDRGALAARREICRSPRGITWDPEADRVVVACAGGSLMGVRGDRVWKIRALDPDLRDVWAAAGGLRVTRFRDAEVQPLRGGRPLKPPAAELPSPATFSGTSPFVAAVAWRTVPAAMGDGAWMLHQRHMDESLPRAPFTYYGDSDGRSVVKSALTYLGDDGPGVGVVLRHGVLPVDVAPSPDGTRVAVAFAARGGVQVFPDPRRGEELELVELAQEHSRAVAVGWSGERVVAQFLDPPRVGVYDAEDGRLLAVTTLGSAPEVVPGRDLFHRATRTDTTCASCHPEAGDDGLVWRLPERRRTPSLTGGLLSTAPFHWEGEHAGMQGLMRSVFEVRMGNVLLEGDADAVGRWLDELPSDRFSVDDPASVERGRRLFRNPVTGCARCHAGPQLTDNRSYDVGTGGVFQTPTLLGLRARAPYFHDGCASTIADRFGRCHTAGHGNLTGLSADEIGDMVAYLASL